MREKESVVITNMCMVTDGSRVLVQDRLDPEWPGLTFPGGHVEAGESFVDSAIREIKEETGIELNLKNIEPFARKSGYYKDWPEEGHLSYARLAHFSSALLGMPNSDRI